MEALIAKKNHWMDSHITEAEFPTPESEQGLALYQAKQTSLTATSASHASYEPSALSIYPVDCHPLTIRYAVVYASQWDDQDEHSAIVEYLTQIMFEPDSPAQLFVGFFKGKPAACGMLYHDSELGTLVSDIAALPVPAQDALCQEMRDALIARAEADSPLFEMQ